MLLARASGLDSCAQEAWALWPRTVRECLAIPADDMLVCGMALGYADQGAPVNGFDSERVAFHEFATILEVIEPLNP